MTLCVFISTLNDLLSMLPPEFLSEDDDCGNAPFDYLNMEDFSSYSNEEGYDEEW